MRQISFVLPYCEHTRTPELRQDEGAKHRVTLVTRSYPGTQTRQRGLQQQSGPHACVMADHGAAAGSTSTPSCGVSFWPPEPGLLPSLVPPIGLRLFAASVPVPGEL